MRGTRDADIIVCNPIRDSIVDGFQVVHARVQNVAQVRLNWVYLVQTLEEEVKVRKYWICEKLVKHHHSLLELSPPSCRMLPLIDFFGSEHNLHLFVRVKAES